MKIKKGKYVVFCSKGGVGDKVLKIEYDDGCILTIKRNGKFNEIKRGAIYFGKDGKSYFKNPAPIANHLPLVEVISRKESKRRMQKFLESR